MLTEREEEGNSIFSLASEADVNPENENRKQKSCSMEEKCRCMELDVPAREVAHEENADEGEEKMVQPN